MVEDLGIIGVDVGEGNDFTTLHLIEYKLGNFCVITSYRM